MLAELFEAEDLPKPIALLALSSMLGGVLALNGGGLAYDHLAHLSGHGVGDAGFAWRATFILFGGAGLMVGRLSCRSDRARHHRGTDRRGRHR